MSPVDPKFTSGDVPTLNKDQAVQWSMLLGTEPIGNIMQVSIGLHAERGDHGEPLDARPRLNTIKVLRRSDERTEFAAWAFRPFQEYFRNGELTLLDPKHEELVMKTIRWTDGYLKRYEDHLPHVDLHRGVPQLEMFEIAARIIDINDEVKWTAGGRWID